MSGQPGTELMASPGHAAIIPNAEKNAKPNQQPAPPPSRAPKPRSCVVCRTRKVRCDKQSPCSNCRRANIACVLPSSDRPPRWARRFDRPAAGEGMERIHYLEGLVKSLITQLEAARAVARSVAASSPSSAHEQVLDSGDKHSPGTSNVQNQFGRLVVQDSNDSWYLGNGFWSRVNDELDVLKSDAHNLPLEDSDLSSEDESVLDKTPSTLEHERPLQSHNLASPSPDLRGIHPLPSQIPFFLSVFDENVNTLAQVIHLPTVTKMIRGLRGDMTKLSPANEALMFSVYYAAVTSMDEDDVNMNFGATKADLNLKYRCGLEYALAKADFLNVPDLTLVQAFSIFLLLARRHDSPRFVWMMTGLAIRMGLALGLHRDGSHFPHLTPYEMEMRRRVWWVLCMIDVRASEDQGAEYTISFDSFDTKLPLNINNADIAPETKEMPDEREGLTDMSFTRVCIITSNATRKMLAHGSNIPNPDEQSRLVTEVHMGLERDYLQYSTESNPAYWLAVTLTRLVMAKMALLVYMPVLFSADENLSDELRSKLLVSAIETAEYNHALNCESSCRNWRWLFQSYTHWYAIVFILIEIHHRPWSPIVERAWVALHSVWLIPPQSKMNKDMRIWLPLRSLMARAKRHRHAEIERLQGNPEAARALEEQDACLPSPASPCPFPAGSNSTELFLHRWRQLVMTPAKTNTLSLPNDEAGAIIDPARLASQPVFTGSTEPYVDYSSSLAAPINATVVRSLGNGNNAAPPVPDVRFDQEHIQPNLDTIPWLWSDEGLSNAGLDSMDMTVDLDGGDVDWYSWVQSAKGAEYPPGFNSGPLG
ncbi:hypothetical protein N7512_007204 [Penicillium capsulatum]|nr:hypothetical protein N7512_007204 [Penicillium capsulatum]